MSNHSDSFVPYAQLPMIDAVGMRHAWEFFGRDDNLGRLNLMNPDTVFRAVRSAESGEVINLCLPLDRPQPNWTAGREPYRHVILTERNTQDDYLDSFYLQGSTQWDGLRHIRAGQAGYYGGLESEEVGSVGNRLGIEHWARHGIIGRGVLVDVARYFSVAGKPFDANEGMAISVDVLREILAIRGDVLGRGDVLMLRTGYAESYLAAPEERRTELVGGPSAGLEADEAMAEFLWDSGVIAVVADNPAVEVVPGDPAKGFLHRRLIPMLGFLLGEFFDLGQLSESCAKKGKNTCLFMAAPLNLPGGVGSPGNALAIL
jgi:kynurenine formamidase